ncbi:hypothetical protein EYF80_016313 [Liparis tanakae]|uniref:Uncharacterized protein n=1 Tax=Liparis tanakae TaxID=230148 RepID=A0A4Z2I8T4_9TELE|nr:hypothetical protein EYF80_016313 [Liparis tanakae]
MAAELSWGIYKNKYDVPENLITVVEQLTTIGPRRYCKMVLRQEHSSGVEGSQPVRGNLCCMGKTPQGSLHICSAVAQGHDGAN